jgi:hypothetical protein
MNKNDKIINIVKIDIDIIKQLVYNLIIKVRRCEIWPSIKKCPVVVLPVATPWSLRRCGAHRVGLLLKGIMLCPVSCF